VIFRTFNVHSDHGVEFFLFGVQYTAYEMAMMTGLLLGIVRNKHPFENREFSHKGKHIFRQRKLNPLNFSRPQMDV